MKDYLCTKCNKTFGFRELIRLTDNWSGRDVNCCPVCEDDTYLKGL